MSRYDEERFLLWFTRATPTWLELSAVARGVAISVAMELNPRTGELPLRKGLASLSVLLRIPWEVLEPAIAELIAAEKLSWDGSRFVLSDPEFAERKRKSSAERMRDKRARDRSSSQPPPSCDASDASDVTSVTPDPCDASDVTSSLVSSSSDLGSRGGMQGETGPPPTERSTTPPTWFVEAAESAAMLVGEVGDLPVRWVGYRASRGRKGWAKNHEDAVSWITDVVRREQREAGDKRDRETQLAAERREREAKWDRQRAGPLPPTERQIITPEEQRRLSEQVPMRRRNRPGEAA